MSEVFDIGQKINDSQFTFEWLLQSLKENDKVYEKNVRIYNKLKDNENNPEEWIKAMLGNDDVKTVITFFEWFLVKGTNWANKIIWKIYLEFLSYRNMKVSKISSK